MRYSTISRPNSSSIGSASSSVAAESPVASSSSSSASPKRSRKEEKSAAKNPATAAPTGEWIENEFVVALEEGKKEVAKVKVRKFQGNIYIDVRKYYENGTKPTTKGVSFKPDLFSKFQNWAPLVRESVDLVEGKIDSLTNQFASAASITRDGSEVSVSAELDKYHMLKVYKFKRMTLVDIRNYYNGGPTKKGIALSPEIVHVLLNWKEWRDAMQKL